MLGVTLIVARLAFEAMTTTCEDIVGLLIAVPVGRGDNGANYDLLLKSALVRMYYESSGW